MSEDGNNSRETSFTPLPPPDPDLPSPDGPPAEVIAPAPVTLRTEGGARPGRARPVMAALTEGALWLQDTWQSRRVPLSALAGVERMRNGRELALRFRPEAAAQTLRLTFAGTAEGRRWHEELQALLQELPPDAPASDRPGPEGVALLRGVADMPHVVLGRVEFTGWTAWMADRGVQLRAALCGADAVIWLWRQKCPEMGGGARHVSGTAIRVEDEAARQRLRLLWYGEEVGGLVKRMLLLLVVQAALLLLVSVFCAGLSRLRAATGETPLEALASAGMGLGFVYVWPLVLLALLRLLRWPALSASRVSGSWPRRPCAA